MVIFALYRISFQKNPFALFSFMKMKYWHTQDKILENTTFQSESSGIWQIFLIYVALIESINQNKLNFASTLSPHEQEWVVSGRSRRLVSKVTYNSFFKPWPWTHIHLWRKSATLRNSSVNMKEFSSLEEKKSLNIRPIIAFKMWRLFYPKVDFVIDVNCAKTFIIYYS